MNIEPVMTKIILMPISNSCNVVVGVIETNNFAFGKFVGKSSSSVKERHKRRLPLRKMRGEGLKTRKKQTSSLDVS